MARSTRYPGADRTRFYGGGQYSGIDQPRLEKIVLHSTETSPKWGCPGYSGGGAAPTFTIDPWSGKVWQHFDTNESARALLNPTSTPVSENRDGVCQIEIIGYSDAKIAKTYGYDLRDLTDAGYAHIAKLVKWIATEWSVPLTFPKEWPAYPASYGNSSARMTSSEYDRFSGVLAHLHVSGNSHGDVTIDVGRLKAALGTTSVGSNPTPKDEIDMASTEDLRKIVREEIARALSSDRITLSKATSAEIGLKSITRDGLAQTVLRMTSQDRGTGTSTNKTVKDIAKEIDG